MAKACHELDVYEFSPGEMTIHEILSISLVHIGEDWNLVEVSGDPESDCWFYVKFMQFGDAGAIRRIITDGKSWYPVIITLSGSHGGLGQLDPQFTVPKNRAQIREHAKALRIDPLIDAGITTKDQGKINKAISEIIDQ